MTTTMFSDTTTNKPWAERFATTGVPADAAMVLSALEAGRHGRGPTAAADRRRGLTRHALRLAAPLRLHAAGGDAPLVVYTRDVTGRSVGFIARQRLPLGYGGTLELPGLDGEPAPVACTILRCTPTVQGWFDAAAAFNRLQPQFE